jgi:hypothetical protein
MIRNLLAVLALMCLGLTVAQAQEDAVGVPGPIVFEGEIFDLVWTSHPTETLYKQEYLPEGQVVEAYGQMFMVDVLLNGTTAEGAAGNMIAGLQERQATDPMVNFDLIQNDATGEIILDFLLSDESTGKLIVEWNAYRYVPLDGGLAMFGISRRGYGDDVEGFLADLADWRLGAIEALANLDLPAIDITD